MAFTVVEGGGKAPIQYWIDYCIKRGLVPQTLTQAGIQFLDAPTLEKNYGKWLLKDNPVGAAVIPASGNLDSEYKKFRIFYRDDATAVPPVKGAQPRRKLAREFGHRNVLYTPPILTDWFEKEYDLFVIESELASLRLAQDGFHAVAIAGVDGWHIGDKATDMVPELKRLVMAKNVRNVTIMHDSDVGERPDLEVALNRLARAIALLRKDKSSSLFICLPPSPTDGNKLGPDDYLQLVGKDAFADHIDAEKKPFDDHPELQADMRWRDRVIYNRSSGLFYDNEIRKEVRAEHINSNMAPDSEVISLKGKVIIYTHQNYLRSHGARIAHGIRYNPNTDDEFYEDQRDGQWYINQYNPKDIPIPVRGDTGLFYQVLENLTPRQPEARKKILIVAAKHAQEPGTIPLYALHFIGEQGAGKTLLAKSIGLSLSSRYHNSRVNLSDTFNVGWRGYACKEWPEYHKEMDAEWLKDNITGEKVVVRAPYQAEYYIDNYCLNIFTANSMKAAIQKGDRRFIVSAGAKTLAGSKLLSDFVEWINGPGPGILRYHLLHDVDTSEYATMSSATESKEEVIEASETYRETVCDLIIQELEQIEGLECVPNKILETLLQKYQVNTISFNKEFGMVFVKPAKEQVKINGYPERFRAFKNQDAWRKEQDAEAYRIQYELATKLVTGKKF